MVCGVFSIIFSLLFKDQAVFSLSGANGRGSTQCADVARGGLTTYTGGQSAWATLATARRPSPGATAHAQGPGPKRSSFRERPQGYGVHVALTSPADVEAQPGPAAERPGVGFKYHGSLLRPAVP